MQTQSKKCKKAGRTSRKPSKVRYRTTKRRERNKLKRIVRSNGMAYAREWARERMVSRFLPS
jgi:ribosomal protein L24E